MGFFQNTCGFISDRSHSRNLGDGAAPTTFLTKNLPPKNNEKSLPKIHLTFLTKTDQCVHRLSPHQIRAEYFLQILVYFPFQKSKCLIRYFDFVYLYLLTNFYNLSYFFICLYIYCATYFLFFFVAHLGFKFSKNFEISHSVKQKLQAAGFSEKRFFCCCFEKVKVDCPLHADLDMHYDIFVAEDSEGLTKAKDIGKKLLFIPGDGQFGLFFFTL